VKKREYSTDHARETAAVIPQEADYYRLRTEWLRYKSHLQDRLTGLPTLPAVLDQVRRVFEARGALDVFYLDLGSSGRQEAKLGWAEYDETIRGFARRLQEAAAAGELDTEDVVCLLTVRSDRFLVFRPAQPNSEPTAAERKERLLAALLGRGGDEAPRVASGHARVVNDPMARSERAIQQAVADAGLMSLHEREGIDSARRDTLRRLIADSAVRAVFHPIVRLSDRGVVGHEALTRPKDPHAFDSVEGMFAFAESTDLLADFEGLCRRTSIREAASLGGSGMLFLNASARAARDPEWTNGVAEQQLRESGLGPQRVVVEITERLAVVGQDGLPQSLRALKERGYRLAVDDMGAGHASLQTLASIEPDFLKFDVSLVRGIDQSSIKRSLLESLRALAEKIRARVIAEGVETEAERRTLEDLGIELAQGFLFHRES
jgi:EAL domain-containing protein (putative c-di-GMP-specific phosphodiesterase class I)